MDRGGYDAKTGIYHSIRDSVSIPYLSLPSLLLQSQAPLHRPAYIDAATAQTLTHGELRHKIQKIAAGLASYGGLRPGDVLFILSPNSINLPLIALATLLAGGIVTLANPLSTPSEISKQVKDSGAKFLCTTSTLLHKLTSFNLPFILLDDAKPAELSSYNSCISLSQLLQADIAQFTSISARPEDTAALLYSSGTTGVSKGVIITHKNLVALATLMHSMERPLHPHYTYLCLIPLFHVYGFAIFLAYLVSFGCKIVVMSRFDMQEMLEAIQRFKITHLPIVPPILLGLTKLDMVSKYDLSSLREIICGAAPISKDVVVAACKRFPGIRIKQGYGMTETTALAAISMTEEEFQHYDSVGRIIPDTEARVVDSASGKPLPPNQKGELWLRGPTVMQGYFGNPGATAATIDSQGWLHTGDLCCFDEDGYLYIVDRLKELIKYKGLQVAPAELEAVLLTHPEIVDAAVIPVDNEEAGQIPMACVVRNPGSNIKEVDVIEFVKSQVAPYKRVRRVSFMDAIPKSQSGKILRRELVNGITSRL